MIGLITVGNQVFKPRTKAFSVILLLLGFFNIIGLAIRDEQDNARGITFPGADSNAYNQDLKLVVLEDNLTLDMNMALTYSTVDGQFIPVKAVGNLTGFVTGFRFDITNVDFKQTPDNTIAYIVHGLVHWQLFGIELYAQEKRFGSKLK
jgi:hypothetical protein